MGVEPELGVGACKLGMGVWVGWGLGVGLRDRG